MEKLEHKINLFIDSGLGGLTTLFQTQLLLPNENYVYVADFLHSPYGNKTKKQIKSIVLKNLKELYKKYDIKSIVIACNTATAIVIQDIRKMFPSTIVIGAEPAVRPALQYGCKKILVLGTRATLNHSGFIKLLKANNHSAIIFCPLFKLAELIDNNYINNESVINKYLQEQLCKYKGKVDGVVLGCTHYIIVKKEIKNILGKVILFNGNAGIAKRLKQCLHIMNFMNKGSGGMMLYSTDKNKQQLLEQSYEVLLKRRSEICVV